MIPAKFGAISTIVAKKDELQKPVLAIAIVMKIAAEMKLHPEYPAISKAKPVPIVQKQVATFRIVVREREPYARRSSK